MSVPPRSPFWVTCWPQDQKVWNHYEFVAETPFRLLLPKWTYSPGKHSIEWSILFVFAETVSWFKTIWQGRRWWPGPLTTCVFRSGSRSLSCLSFSVNPGYHYEIQPCQSLHFSLAVVEPNEQPPEKKSNMRNNKIISIKMSRLKLHIKNLEASKLTLSSLNPSLLMFILHQVEQSICGNISIFVAVDM